MTVFLADGFESGDETGWNLGKVLQTVNDTFVVNSNNVFQGNYNGECYAVAGEFAGVGEDLASTQPIVYERGYHKFPALPANGEQYEFNRMISTGDMNHSVSGALRTVGADSLWSVALREDSAVATFYDEAVPSNPVTGRYYCVEVLRDLTNQIARLWVDGVLKVNATGLSMTLDTKTVYGGIAFNDSASPLTLYIDSFIVSDQYNGPAGGVMTAIITGDAVMS